MSTEESKAVAPQGLVSSAETLPILAGGETPGNVSTEAAESVAPQRTTSRMSQTMLTIAIAWFAVSAALGLSGFFSEYSRFIILFVVTPLVVFGAAFAVSRGVRAWALAFDTRTLVSFQTVRVAGIAWLAAYAAGALNGTFALWAGLLDAVTGCSALFAAHYLTATRSVKQRGLLIAWMAVGILDLVVAIPLALIARAGDPASMAASTIPPLSMITTYAVPLALMDYFILGAQLWQQRGRAAAGAPALTEGG
jgi:hypothetical protein